ncbi:esterase-like activity of phytase family protein [Dactylosporangium sp. NPDC000555]|uniref:esterase-like activity of phytase family protein n=1 Tax=Dactylosporangium sp. NPDC000555 TaxID=3154260 RepID=UPI00332522BD
MRNLRRVGLGVGVGVLSLAISAPSASANGSSGHAWGQAQLTGWAALPAATFVSASDPSGALLGGTPSNGITPPFDDQPIQGFSGILKNGDGTFDVISDNGYGNKANSGDFVLRIHRVAPDYAKKTVDVVGGINLTDPSGFVPWALTRKDRVLTGADFDIESIQRVGDGSYWIGDEFGPYLLHFDRAGRLLQAPISLPGVRAPENPEGNPNLNSSKGFEGMALSPDGRTLYPMLEGTVAGDPAGSLRFNEFDLVKQRYTGKIYTYQMEDPGYSIGDAIAVDADRFLIIERDQGQGATAKFKRIYLADKRDRNRDGKMDKTLVADLMNIADPRHLGGTSNVFTFPFQTIEDVVILDDRTLGVVNDNNFPFSSGRTPGKPDDDEFITIRLANNLHADKRFLR